VKGVDGVRYQLVVEGELGPRFSDAFENMHVEAHEGTTVITGTIKDQAHLHGLLAMVASLGLKLVSVSPEEDQDTATPARSWT
jgi:hypothetical protein